MIGFIKLSIPVLQELRGLGFNILRSTAYLDDPDPSWIPDSVDVDKITVSMQEKHLLFIDDALANMDDDDLIGQVFYICAETPE